MAKDKSTWGKKVSGREAVARGGTTSGKQAKNATQAGHLGDDDRVYHRGRVVADLSNRQRRQGNANGV